MIFKIPVLSVKAKLLTLILFLVFILLISGHFLQQAITDRIADINQRTALVNVLTDASEGVQINTDLYYPLRSVLYDPSEKHRDEYKGHMADFTARTERIAAEDPGAYGLLRINIDRLMLLAEGRGDGDILANSEAVEQVTDILMQNDRILRGLKERLEKKLQHHAVSSIHQTETLYFIPFFYVIGGLAVLAFVILIAMMDIFRPVSHVTKAMISASYNPRLARNYLVRMDRADEIGRFAQAFNTLVSEVADNIAKVEQKERQLMESWRYLQAVLDNVVDGIIIMDERGAIESFNPRAREIFGYDELEVVGRIFEIVHQDALPVAAIDFTSAGGAPASLPAMVQEDPRELEIRRKDGILIPAEITVGRAQYNGRVIYVAAVRDISLRRQMEALLEQTQRMETVARMTGGVAHDFNNMLTVISGSLELLERRAGDPEKSRALIESALETVERGRELTQRLLAFSRKQILQPRLININDQMDRMIMLVRSVLPENIEIIQHLAPDLWRAQIDPNQLESAILNLALNARDAISEAGREEGRVEIRTENIVVKQADSAALGNTRPGDYVRISVRDNGKGIARAVRKRVFDPFFTTKDVGKGTGLGLSMVYGFARQSGGYAAIADGAERGGERGAEIVLYFPRATTASDAPENMRMADADMNEDVPTGTERILLVEDEPQVLDFMTDLLRDLGYKVLTAANGPEAIAILEGRPVLDLVITDIVMPGGLTGEDVAACAAEICPQAKVLYISGYTKDALIDRGHLREGVALLSKPFSLSGLARKVREILD